MFKKPVPARNLLTEAHTLGSSALQSFEDLATDLEVAADLAAEHGDKTAEQARLLAAEADDATVASGRYASSATKIRELVS